MNSAKLTTQSGHTWKTSLSVNSTEESAKAYFLGKVFDIGNYPEERMEMVTNFEWNPA